MDPNLPKTPIPTNKSSTTQINIEADPDIDTSSDLNSMNSPKHSISINSSLLTSSPSVLEQEISSVITKQPKSVSSLLSQQEESKDKEREKERKTLEKENTEKPLDTNSAQNENDSTTENKSLKTTSFKTNSNSNSTNTMQLNPIINKKLYRDEIISSCQAESTSILLLETENIPLLNQTHKSSSMSTHKDKESHKSLSTNNKSKNAQNININANTSTSTNTNMTNINTSVSTNTIPIVKKKRRHSEKTSYNKNMGFRDKYIPKYNSDHLSIHKCIDPIIIQTDPIKYKIHGLVDHFDETMPNDLIGKLSPDEFKITINLINKFLKSSLKRQYRLLLLGTILCGCTAGLSFIPAYKSNYDILNKLKKILDDENERIYHKMLNMKWGLIIRPVNQRFLEYNLIVEFVPRFNFTMPE